MAESASDLSYQHVSAELRVYHGRESLVSLGREIERSKCQRAVVICGRTISQSPVLQLVRDALGPKLVGVSPSAREQSPVSGVEQAAGDLSEARADAIIAIGGGSAAVTARAAAILLGENKPLSELCTRRLEDGTFSSPRLGAPKLPQFIVPTTPSTAFVKAGTAVHDDAGQRLAMFDPKTRAKAIFVHPEFVATAPESLVRSAALNALANAVEALNSPKCDPVSEAFLLQALRLIRAELPALTERRQIARERLLVAAILCGRGTEQGGTGLASVLAHAIGHRSHAANGIVNAVVLPHVMRFNAPVTRARGKVILEVLSSSPEATADDAPAGKAVQAFLDGLPVPHTLRDLGIGQADLPGIAQAAFSDWFISRNPRPVNDVAALMDILQAAL